MNLLEQAMRHKAMRNPQTNSNPSSLPPTPSPSPLPGYPVSKNRLMAGGLGIVLAAAVTGTLLVTLNNGRSATPPAMQFDPAAAAQNAANDDREKVLAFVEGWAQAWSEQAADKYLSAYAPEFIPANGLSRPVWEKQRRQRLSRYNKIEVKLTNLAVSVAKDTASVEFIQSFRADKFTETGVHKRLDLKLQGSRWMITREAISPG